MKYKNKLFYDDKKSDMAILVVSYDGYSDLWDDFFSLMNKYWNKRIYPTYLANNIKSYECEGVKVINCGKEAQWSTRTKIALNIIKEQYICLLVEDYFIGDIVQDDQISEALELMSKDQLKYYKLNDFIDIKADKYKDFSYLKNIPKNLEYGISLQPAIWDRDFLIKLLGEDDYSVWKFELDQVKKANDQTSDLIEGCVYDNRNILNICHGVVQGKLLPSAIKHFKDKDYVLNTKVRPVMGKPQYFIYRSKLFFKKILTPRTRKLIKSGLTKLGMEFVSNKHDK